MQLENYFDFLAPNDIRLKGHRVGIETILFDYLDGLTAEEIALRYPTLSMEKIYATLTYYWRKKSEIDAYLKAAEEHERHMREEQERNPPPIVTRLRTLIQARQHHAIAEDPSTYTT